jgi:NodT family efflux transporter outer membrane factor (OMF) lipoprotein
MMRKTCSSLAIALVLAGCGSMGERYQVPAVDTPAAFKEGQGTWVPAAPADTLSRGPWWRLFNDPVLDSLVSQVEVTNQNVALAVANYAQARALVAQQRAALFPSVSLSTSANRSGGGGNTPERNNFAVTLGTSWEPDVFGRLTVAIEGARSSLQASAADLASATLAAQGEVAANYVNLRAADAQRALLQASIEGYQRSLQIARNRYNAGVVARTDVLQAETQLANTQADLLSLERQRAQLEHAIAVLLGRAPANFSIAPVANWQASVPSVPLELPSELLQRRPDIAAAERRVAQANAQIGIARSGYYPRIALNGSLGSNAPHISDLFQASSLVWALGASLAQTIFDAGATRAQVQAARAGLETAAARYRQTVLTAFQNVEDQLVAARVLQQQYVLREQAARSADLVEQQVLNRYRAGQVNYTEVVTAQASASSARRALVQAQADRQTAVVSLIQALGGGWSGLPDVSREIGL